MTPRALVLVVLLSMAGCGREPSAYRAVRAGDLAALSRALDDGADPDAMSRAGWPPIVEAAYAGRADMVSRLIAHHARIDATNTNGFSALSEAAREGHSQIVGQLIAARADIRSSDRRMHQTAVAWAIQSGHIDIVKLLLAAGADPEGRGEGGSTPLLIAISAGQADAVRMLLDAGANPNVGIQRGEVITLPLEEAAASEGDQVGMIEALLDHGAEIDAFGWKDNTALIAAAQHDNRKCVAALLDRGADINHIGGYYQRTPLAWAVENRDQPLTEMLRDRGGVLITRTPS